MPFTPRRPKELQRVWTTLSCMACEKEFSRYVYPSQDPPKYCSRKCAGVGRRNPLDEATLIDCYVTKRLTLVATAEILGLGENGHKAVWTFLKGRGLLRTERLKAATCKYCDQPASEGRLCQAHNREYKRNWRNQNAHRLDPGIGTRRIGRQPIPRVCVKCGVPCQSTREAQAHCCSRKQMAVAA